MELTSQTEFVVISPHTVDYGGHKYIYSKCLEQAGSLNGWAWKLILPWFSQVDLKSARILKPPLPRSLYPLFLNREYRGPSKWKRFKAFFAYGFSLRKAFQRKGNTLFLIETFYLHDLEVLFWVLRFTSKKNLSLALIHRYHVSFFNEKTTRYLFLLKQLIKKIPNLYFFTDTEPLKIAYEKEFSKLVTLLPIPHLEDISRSEKKEKGLCWWPGEPRLEKGLLQIQSLASLSGKTSFTLALSEKALLPKKGGAMTLKLLAYPLPREKYTEMLSLSEFIFLPYQGVHYEYSSSGIFVETVMAGSTPLVTPRTWMAFELNKRGLGELIIEHWDESLFERLEGLRENNELVVKLQNLRCEYASFHTQDRFASLIKQGFGIK